MLTCACTHTNESQPNPPPSLPPLFPSPISHLSSPSLSLYISLPPPKDLKVPTSGPRATPRRSIRCSELLRAAARITAAAAASVPRTPAQATSFSVPALQLGAATCMYVLHLSPACTSCSPLHQSGVPCTHVLQPTAPIRRTLHARPAAHCTNLAHPARASCILLLAGPTASSVHVLQPLTHDERRPSAHSDRPGACAHAVEGHALSAGRGFNTLFFEYAERRQGF